MRELFFSFEPQRGREVGFPIAASLSASFIANEDNQYIK